jgi:hypothetical protein
MAVVAQVKPGGLEWAGHKCRMDGWMKNTKKNLKRDTYMLVDKQRG